MRAIVGGRSRERRYRARGGGLSGRGGGLEALQIGDQVGELVASRACPPARSASARRRRPGARRSRPWRRGSTLASASTRSRWSSVSARTRPVRTLPSVCRDEHGLIAGREPVRGFEDRADDLGPVVLEGQARSGRGRRWRCPGPRRRGTSRSRSPWGRRRSPRPRAGSPSWLEGEGRGGRPGVVAPGRVANRVVDGLGDLDAERPGADPLPGLRTRSRFLPFLSIDPDEVGVGRVGAGRRSSSS